MEIDQVIGVSMGWSHALYYPWIQVRDAGWLKNAVLHWDVVSTIVPDGLASPYSSADETALADVGWLRPLWLRGDEDCVTIASFGTLKLVRKLGMRLRARGTQGMMLSGAEGFDRLLEEVAFGKYSTDLELELKRRGLFVDGQRGQWPSIDRTVFDIHMTHLAHSLATQRNLALVSEDHGLTPIADSLAAGRALPVSLHGGHLNVPLKSLARWYDGYDYRRLASGALSRYVLRTVGVTADTPVAAVIRFRERHQDELARLRATLDDLAAEVATEYPTTQAFEQAVLDIFRNKVNPALSDLEQAKKASRLSLAPSLISGTLIGTPAEVQVVNSYLTPVGKIVAAVAVAGLSLTAVAIKYSLDRHKNLSNGPYSFVLAARREFGPGPEWRARPRRWSPGRTRRPY